MPARRYVYLALFVVPTLLLSAIVGALMVGAAAGAFWLFVFGDDTWPAQANLALGAVFVIGGGLCWATLLAIAYQVGKQQESRQAINKVHVALAVGSTTVLAALIAVRLMGVTLVGPTDTMRCADYCQSQGFSASGMPSRDSGDRTCTCYGPDGTARTTTTIDP